MVRPGARLFGLRIAIDDRLPLEVPTDGENARRIVRHGLKHVLTRRGEAPGLRPGEAIHAYIAREPLDSEGGRNQGVLHISRDLAYCLDVGFSPRFDRPWDDRPVVYPNAHGAFLMRRIEEAGLRPWQYLGRTAEIPFTPQELRP